MVKIRGFHIKVWNVGFSWERKEPLETLVWGWISLTGGVYLSPGAGRLSVPSATP
jgi:hypothetical protein